MRHIAKYYDNSLKNIGRKNSYVWYGPRWAQAATAPGRLYKTFTSEGGIRVPFILRYPPLTSSPANHGIVHSFSTVMDLFPTILELAGIPPVGSKFHSRNVVPVRGASWVPFLKKQRHQIHAEDHVTGWELFGRMGVRKGKWKATFIPEPHGPGEWELFDLEADPGETKDLSKQEGTVFKELLVEWDRYVSETGVIGIPPEYGNLRVD
jgi:arylsulfatase A-like enzyme